MYTKFDKTEIYDTRIQEKVDELVQICNREHIPLFVAACVKNDENDSEYRIDMYASASNQIMLKKDFLPKFVNVTNGFTTIPPADIVDIDFD